jgi:sugar lactone lactonase YvrE
LHGFLGLCVKSSNYGASPEHLALREVAEEEEQMIYPQIRMVRHGLRAALLAALVVFALGACGGGGAKDGAEKAATIKTVAGDGGSHLGDSGPATEAAFCGTSDVTLDASGNMYIADGGIYCSGPGGHTVRKVDRHGIITTVAGTGEAGFSGDGGPATKAQLDVPFAVAADREGNLYITDENNLRIRKVDKDGIITTFAGTGEDRHSGDGGPATSAQLRDPGGIAFDTRGNLYVADYTSVRKIDPSGTITTVAGTGELGFSGDGGPATEAKLTAYDLALDHKGNIYICDLENQRIRKVDRDGIIHTVAGSGKKGYSGDRGPATNAALKDPWGIAVDREENVYIADHHNRVVRKVDPEGTITTIAGTGEAGFNREEGPATKVMLQDPIGLFFDDDSGVLYIADTLNARIRALRLEGS